MVEDICPTPPLDSQVRFVVVLAVYPVNSFESAVKAGVVAESKTDGR